MMVRTLAFFSCLVAGLGGCVGDLPAGQRPGDAAGAGGADGGQPQAEVPASAADTGAPPKGDGTFADEVRLPAGDAPHGIAIADLDRDGLDDVVFANHAPTVSVLYRKGSATFAPKVTYQVGQGTTHALWVGDLNGDGKPDLAAASAESNTVSVLLNAWPSR